jgi:beta-glucosidase
MTSISSLEQLAGRFPSDFVWGAATSAFQIEGASTADGKGPSIWDEFCRLPGVIADGSTGDVACDHYNRLESDLDLLAELGVNAYRFSIAWPRIQPLGSGPVNKAGLAFYDRLVDGLLSRNIKPYATLYHWDLPAALQHRGDGWVSRETAYRFADYAQIIGRHMGDRLVSIATHNEPWVTAVLGYERGIFAPGIRSQRMAYQAAHHLLLSHGLAVQALTGLTRADLGIVLNLSPVFPATSSDADVAEARIEDGKLVRWYVDPLLRKQYPEDILSLLGSDAPHVAEGDLEIISQPLDFIGINYYHPLFASKTNEATLASPGAQVTGMGWEVMPGGLTHLLQRLHADYRLPRVYIMENGAAYDDQLTSGRVDDEPRRDYVERHISAVADARDQGVPIDGYFVWSLLDNFEWAQGYSKRFGIVHVDYETQRRTFKASAQWYRSLLRATRK